MGPFRAEKITEKVYWVGAIDWGVRDFHGYLTSRGSTYNAFLIIDEKVTLVDTVKKPFMKEMTKSKIFGNFTGIQLTANPLSNDFKDS